MKQQILLFVVVITVVFSCNREEKPKVVYPENDSAEITELPKDTTFNEVSDIPIHIDSTEYLIHPIGEYKIYKSRSKYSFGSSGYSSSRTFNVSNNNRDHITGNIHNVKFQHVKSESFNELTSKNIRITSIVFLRSIFNSTKKQLLIYKVIDKDTNRDNELDDDDVKSLYISDIDGLNFRKLTLEYHELIDWNVIEIKNRLYFRSVEDTNKNGEFDKNDKVHYYYIDFNNELIEVTEYNPIQN